MINIALADDHTMLRKGVIEILSGFSGMSVLFDAVNGKELISKIEAAQTKPDVCIIDINMPEMNGYETAAAIKQKWSKIKILALSMYDTEHNIIKMLRSGAHGYILKDNDPEDLKTAINHVYNEGFYHSDLVTSRIVHQLHDPNANAAIEISEKEQQFLKHCCTDLAYKEIAGKMGLSARTIDGYREALFAKIKTNSRTGLVIFAIRSGIADV